MNRVSILGGDIRGLLNGSDPSMDRIVGHAEVKLAFTVDAGIADTLRVAANVIDATGIDTGQLRMTVRYDLSKASYHEEIREQKNAARIIDDVSNGYHLMNDVDDDGIETQASIDLRAYAARMNGK